MRKALALAAVFPLVAALAGCATIREAKAVAGADAKPRELGAFALASPAWGAAAIHPAFCASGAHQQFLGADFADEKSGWAVRLAIDPLAGPAVRVYSTATPFDKTLVFRRADCRTFHFTLDTTGWRIDHYDDYRVTLEIDCGDAASGTLEGSASVDHCH